MITPQEMIEIQKAMEAFIVPSLAVGFAVAAFLRSSMEHVARLFWWYVVPRSVRHRRNRLRRESAERFRAALVKRETERMPSVDEKSPN